MLDHPTSSNSPNAQAITLVRSPSDSFNAYITSNTFDLRLERSSDVHPVPLFAEFNRSLDCLNRSRLQASYARHARGTARMNYSPPFWDTFRG